MQVLVVYYSLFGHVRRLAEAVAEGAREVQGAVADLRRVPETLPPEVIDRMGAKEAQAAQASVPVCTLEELEQAAAIILGAPTRFGNMCGQMRQFLDATGGLWSRGALVGKVGSVFTSTGTQHGGQESTILSSHLTLLHHGMIVVGLPYAFKGQMRTDAVAGCSPYGASTVAGSTGDLAPTPVDLEGARFQGRHVADIARRLTRE